MKNYIRVKNMCNDKNKKYKSSSTPSVDIDERHPDDCYEMVNRFGRCNVQATNNTDNDYPAIAQGLSEKTQKELHDERDRWKHQNDKESGGKYKH